MKQSKITIKDAKRKGGKGYRVQSVAKNGEVLQSSQVLDTVANVRKHIEAMSECWDTFYRMQTLDLAAAIEYYDFPSIDLTKDQAFVKKGWAKTGLPSKTK